MKTPPFLKKGDQIRLIAPSRFIEEDDLKKAVSFYEQNGFKVTTGDHILSRKNQFAGSTKERSSDLQEAVNDPAVKAIIAFRGGYGAAKIVDHVEWSAFEKNPKWFCGYSDATAIHYHLQSMGWCSLHSTMPIHLKSTDEESIMSFYAQLEVLKGEPVEYYLKQDKEQPIIEGKVIGGNLSVLYSILGSSSDFEWSNYILFLEDLDEYLYHIDRMANALDRAQKLRNLKAIVLGSFSQMNDNEVPFGSSAETILKEYASRYSIPVFEDFPSGHQPLNLPIILGSKVKIENGVMVYAN